jgi:hypothetical protein
MSDTATLQVRLAEAELAYHRLQTGVLEVECQHDGMAVKYSLASVDKLRAYIADLKAQLVAAGALDATASSRRKPLYVQL